MKENTVTNEHIQAILYRTEFKSRKMGDKTTVVCAKLPSGFEIVEASSCVDRDNYDHDLGESICRDRITNRIWQLEGYLLQTRLAESHDARQCLEMSHKYFKECLSGVIKLRKELARLDTQGKEAGDSEEPDGPFVCVNILPSVWAVGYYTPEGDWKEDQSFNTMEMAARRVALLNGGRK